LPDAQVASIGPKPQLPDGAAAAGAAAGAAATSAPSAGLRSRNLLLCHVVGYPAVQITSGLATSFKMAHNVAHVHTPCSPEFERNFFAAMFNEPVVDLESCRVQDVRARSRSPLRDRRGSLKRVERPTVGKAAFVGVAVQGPAVVEDKLSLSLKRLPVWNSQYPV
jgi:hypothetical protein